MSAYLEEWVEYLPEVEDTITAAVVYSGQSKRIAPDDIQRLAGVLAMIWREGDRHALSLAVPGILAKEGYAQQDAEILVQIVCAKTGDSEATDRIRSVRDTYLSAALGQPVKAWSELAQYPATMKYVEGILNPPPPAVVEEEEDDPYRMPFKLTERRDFPSFPMLIDGILPSDPRGQVCYLAGLSQSFKSYAALDWAAHISEGMNWHGHNCEQGQVFYICAEGSYKDLLSRLRAWEAHNGRRAEQLYCRLSPINILDGSCVESLLTRLCRNDAFRPRLVILDTLSQCGGGMDENSSKDARAIYANAKKFGEAWGSTVLLVHHAGKAEGAIGRGSSAFFDDCDAWIQMVRPGWQSGGMDCTMNLKKIKSGRLILGHEMQAREVEWEADGRTGKDLVLVQRVLRSAFEGTPKLY